MNCLGRNLAICNLDQNSYVIFKDHPDISYNIYVHLLAYSGTTVVVDDVVFHKIKANNYCNQNFRFFLSQLVLTGATKQSDRWCCCR